MIIPKDMEHGTIHETNHGKLEVLKYIKSTKIMVRFISTGYEAEVTAASIRNGSVRDPFKPSVAGVGFIGAGNNRANLGFLSHTRYDCWRNMLVRCYDERVRSKYPTYADCTVCDEWHNFQNFAAWYDEQSICGSEKYDLDKDILSDGGKVYSPSTCIMIPRWINTFISRSRSDNAECLIGASFDVVRNKFRSTSVYNGKTKYLGIFNTESEAHRAWADYRISIAKEKKREMDDVDVRIYPAIIRIINMNL